MRALAGLVVSGLCLCAVPAAAGERPASAAQAPLCTAGRLAGAIIDVQGAAGSRFGRLILTNTSGQSCRTRGFIGGRLIAAGGAPLPTPIVHEAPSPPRRVIIRSGAAASVGIAWSVIPSGNRPCRTARWLRVRPPHATRTIRVFFGSTACRGTIRVRPVVPAGTV